MTVECKGRRRNRGMEKKTSRQNNMCWLIIREETETEISGEII